MTTTTTADPTTTTVAPTTTTVAPLVPVVYSVVAEVSVPETVEYFRQRPFFRVRVVITGFQGFLDGNLFVHDRVPVGMTAQFRDEFIGVAGPVDIVDFSNVPNARMRLRKDRVDMLIESHALYDELVKSITLGLRELVEGMRRLDQMNVVRTIYVT